MSLTTNNRKSLLTREDIYRIGVQYCQEKGYDASKVLYKYCFDLPNINMIGVSANVVPDGMLNDVQTMPIPVLIISDDGKTVTETEYTAEKLGTAV